MEVLKEKSLLSNIGIQVVIIANDHRYCSRCDDGWQRNYVRSTAPSPSSNLIVDAGYSL